MKSNDKSYKFQIPLINMKLRQILDILFWILLIIVIILIIWRIFGNSPTDLAIIIPAIFMVLLKMWSISDNLKDFQYKTTLSFHKVREEINGVKENINEVNNRLNKVENRLDKIESKLNKNIK